MFARRTKHPGKKTCPRMDFTVASIAEAHRRTNDLPTVHCVHLWRSSTTRLLRVRRAGEEAPTPLLQHFAHTVGHRLTRRPRRAKHRERLVHDFLGLPPASICSKVLEFEMSRFKQVFEHRKVSVKRIALQHLSSNHLRCQVTCSRASPWPRRFLAQKLSPKTSSHFSVFL